MFSPSTFSTQIDFRWYRLAMISGGGKKKKKKAVFLHYFTNKSLALFVLSFVLKCFSSIIEETTIRIVVEGGS